MTVRTPPTFLQAGSHTAENTRLAHIGFFGSAPGSFAGGVSAVDAAHGVVRAGSTQLQVTENGTPNMSVNVAAGGCFIRGTESASQGVYHFFNDGTVNLSISAADATNNRKDLVVAQVRDSGYSGADDDARLFVVEGTAAAAPVDPTLPENCLVLARVSVAAGATSIVDANITDLRTYARPWNTAWGVVAVGEDTVERTNRTTAAAISANVSVTVVSPGSRRYRISGFVRAEQNTSTGSQALSVYKGGSVLRIVSNAESRPAASVTNHSGDAYDTPSAGSATYDLRLFTTAGTVDARGDTTSTRIVVEDVGPA